MMQDVDSLSRYHDPLVAVHIALANVYQIQDKSNRKDSNSLSTFDKLLKTKNTLSSTHKVTQRNQHSLS